MLYEPTKKEVKQIKNLNKAYQLLRQAFAIIGSNIPKNQKIEDELYTITKHLDIVVKIVAESLEKQFISKEFLKIVKNFDIKKDKK